MILETPAQRRDLLERSKTVAVVGASNNPMRPSYTVFSYLRTQHRFAIAAINPTIAEIDGVPAYPSLTAYAQANGAPDIVDVFRKPSEVAAAGPRGHRGRGQGDLVSIRRHQRGSHRACR